MATSVLEGVEIVWKFLITSMPIREPWVLLFLIPLLVGLLWIIKKNFIKFVKKEDRDEYIASKRWIRRAVLVLRSLTIIFLVIALATPFHMAEKTIDGDLEITLLVDRSKSMEIFDQTIADTLADDLEQFVPTTTLDIATADNSPLGDAILHNLQGGDNLLIISDGNNNHGRDLGDVMLLAQTLGSTISAVNLEPIKEDTSVSIYGPRTVIAGSEAEFTIRIQQAGPSRSYRVKIDVDGAVLAEQTSSGSKTFTFRKLMREGYHKVTAQIFIDDENTQNNKFLKTIHSLPKPKILFVSSKESPMLVKLREVYDVTTQGDIATIGDHTAVILNDMPYNQIGPEATNRLVDFVTDGGGLMVIGGQASYDRGGYKGSYFESLLPAKTGLGKSRPDRKMNIVFAIDISGSTGSGFAGVGTESKVSVQKALAIRLIQDLQDGDNVGIVAFNAQGFVISPLSKLGPKRQPLMARIASLVDDGGTYVDSGISKAEQLLLGAKGSKNIIIFSDGVTFAPGEAMLRAQGAKRGGITTYTVSVGEQSDADFMTELARAGGGIHFKPDRSQHLKIIFGETPDPDDVEGMNLIILNANHFITNNITLEGEVSGFNQVTPKASASNLVVTGSGNPIITVWRFGLGRVVTLASDDGGKWAGTLLAKENSKVLTRTINWAIGDPTRNKRSGVFAKDTYLGESAEIIVRSSQIPSAYGVKFQKVDDDLYRGIFTPAKTGFFTFGPAQLAVNYPKEYRDVGFNPELADVVRVTGGQMFEPDDLKGILEKTKTHAKRKEIQETPLRWPFLLGALVFFLIEIVLRRVKEYMVVGDEG